MRLIFTTAVFIIRRLFSQIPTINSFLFNQNKFKFELIYKHCRALVLPWVGDQPVVRSGVSVREIGSPSSQSRADPVAASGFPKPPSATAARTSRGHLTTRMFIAIKTPGKQSCLGKPIGIQTLDLPLRWLEHKWKPENNATFFKRNCYRLRFKQAGQGPWNRLYHF